MDADPPMQPPRKRGETWRRILLAFLAVVLSAQLCELLARGVLKPPLTDRVEILDPDDNLGGDCYPRSRNARLPLDLANERDEMSFFGRMPHGRSAWPDTENGKELLQDLIPLSYTYFRLIRLAPLCAVYDLSEKSPRRIVTPPGFRKTYAVLGDSFAFGQGVADDETFTSRLANLTGARIRSYAAKGANIPEVLTQFDQAMKEAKKLKVSKILYVYVLNDPYVASTLEARINVINDLMNVRLSAAEVDQSKLMRFASKWSHRSVIVRSLLRMYASRRVTRETLQFYRDIHDPALNFGLVDTFNHIAEMRDRAKKQGIDFAVLVYPMMLDMSHYPLADAHRHLAEMAAKHGITLHDLLPAFQRHAGETITVHPIDMHPNGHAHAIAAEDAAAFLAAPGASFRNRK